MILTAVLGIRSRLSSGPGFLASAPRSRPPSARGRRGRPRPGGGTGIRAGQHRHRGEYDLAPGAALGEALGAERAAAGRAGEALDEALDDMLDEALDEVDGVDVVVGLDALAGLDGVVDDGVGGLLVVDDEEAGRFLVV